MKSQSLIKLFSGLLLAAGMNQQAAAAWFDFSAPLPEEIVMPWSVKKDPFDLGTGYYTKTDSFKGVCMEGETYIPRATGDLKESMKTNYGEMSKSLGMSAGARFRTTVLDTNAVAEFAQSSTDTGYTVNLLYKFQSDLTEKFAQSKGKNVTPREDVKEMVSQGSKASYPFREQCGNMAVQSVEKIASLLVKVSVSFSSRQAANSFSSTFKMSYNSGATSGGIDLSAANAAYRLDKNSTLDVTVIQIGGNPGMSSRVLCPVVLNSEQPDLAKCGQSSVKCGSGDFTQCQQFLQEVKSYAAGSFSKQITDEKGRPENYVINSITLRPYAKASKVFPPPVTGMEDSMMKASLESLNTAFENFFPLWLEAKRANFDHRPRLNGVQGPIMAEMDSALNKLTLKIQQGVADCQAKGVEACMNVVKDLQKKDGDIQAALGSISEEISRNIGRETHLKSLEDLRAALELYTRPESYAQFCDMKGEANPSIDYAVRAIEESLKKNQSVGWGRIQSAKDPCAAEQEFLKSVTVLDVDGKAVETGSKEMHMGPFSVLPSLTRLTITNGRVRDVKPLAQLSKLAYLNLNNNELLGVDEIQNLPLETLNLKDNRIRSIHAFRNSSTLKNADLRGTGLNCTALPNVGSCKSEDLSTSLNSRRFTEEVSGPAMGVASAYIGGGIVLAAGGISPSFNEKTGLSFQASNQIRECSSTYCQEVGTLKEPRAFATATRIGNLVVIAGGGRSSIEIYDPVTKQTKLLQSHFFKPRSLHSATLLAGGKKILFVGGYEDTDYLALRKSAPSSTFEIFNLETQLVEFRGPLRLGRAEHTISQIGEGKFLIAGGYGSARMIDQAEILDIDGPASQSIEARMQVGRAGHAAIVTGGKVFLLGGFVWNEETKETKTVKTLGGTTSVEVFDIASGKFLASEEKLSDPRGGIGLAQVDERRWLLIGGTQSENLVHPYVECKPDIDPNDPQKIDKNKCGEKPVISFVYPNGAKGNDVRVNPADTRASDAVDIFDEGTLGVYGGEGGRLSTARGGAVVSQVDTDMHSVLVIGGAGSAPASGLKPEVVIYK